MTRKKRTGPRMDFWIVPFKIEAKLENSKSKHTIYD